MQFCENVYDYDVNLMRELCLKLAWYDANSLLDEFNSTVYAKILYYRLSEFTAKNEGEESTSELNKVLNEVKLSPREEFVRSLKSCPFFKDFLQKVPNLF